MSRLIAFGCSNTYGHGLSDCYIPPDQPGPVASKTAWPSTLGKLLNVKEVINQGNPGASNKLIWKTIVDFNFKQDDLVFINWSHLNRHCVFGEVYNTYIGPWVNEKGSKFYYKHLYSELDSKLEFYNRADHAKRYLDSLNIKNFHLLMRGKIIDNTLLHKPSWFSVDCLTTSLSDLREIHPMALDGRHPGQLAHNQYANEIYLEVKEFI